MSVESPSPSPPASATPGRYAVRPAIFYLVPPSPSPERNSLIKLNGLLAGLMAILIIFDLLLYGAYGTAIFLGPLLLVFYLVARRLTQQGTPSRWWVRVSFFVCTLHMIVFGIGFLASLAGPPDLELSLFSALFLVVFGLSAWYQAEGYPIEAVPVTAPARPIRRLWRLSGGVSSLLAGFFLIAFTISVLASDAFACVISAGVWATVFLLAGRYQRRRAKGLPSATWRSAVEGVSYSRDDLAGKLRR